MANTLPPRRPSEEQVAAVSDAFVDLFPRSSAGEGSGTPQDHWFDGRVLVEHGDPKDLEESIAARFPTPGALAAFDPDMLVSVYGFQSAAGSVGSATASEDVQDLFTFPPQPVGKALQLYDEGHTIVCWQMVDHLPEARRRARDILATIGMPDRPVSSRGLSEPWSSTSPFVVSLVYSPAGGRSGLGMHFDRFDSLVVHLRGSKRWRVGRHPLLSFPIYNEELGAQLDFPPSLSRLSTRSEYISALETIDMRPGSVLLLPRGNYHTTLADDEASLSIGYHFALPTWSHVVLGALELELTRDPLLRTTPFGAFSPDGPSEAVRDSMRWAVERAQDILRDPERLLHLLLGNVASHEQAVFRLLAGAPARLQPSDPPVITNYGARGFNVELTAEAGPLCCWLVDTSPRDFAFDTAYDASDGRMSPRAVWDLLQEAVEAGVLERRWGRSRRDGAPDAG